MNTEQRLAAALRNMLDDPESLPAMRAGGEALAAYDAQTSIDTLKAQAAALQDDLLLFLLSDDAPAGGARWDALNDAVHHLGSALVYLRRAQGQVVRDSVDAA